MNSRRLRIADVRVSLCFPQPWLSLATALEASLSPDDSCDPDLKLVLESGPPIPPELTDPLTSAAVHGARTADGFWFERVQTAMWASEDFSHCRTWTRRVEGMPAEFNGRPWLMFALWGYLAQRGGVFLHGATCVLDGKYVLLLADSQVGKSTLARLAAEAGHTALTDEYPAVTLGHSGPRAHGLPWPGRQGLPAPASGDLAAIFFLRQAPHDSLRQLDATDTARLLIQNIRFFGWDKATTLPTFATLDQIAKYVPAWEVSFAPTPDAVDMLVQAL